MERPQNGETALSVITTTLLTLCDPVSMTEAISLLEVSVQKSHYPQTIKEYEERIAGYENDAALTEQHKPQGEDKFCPMTLKGVTYTEKADAGEMLLAICKDYPMSAPTEIGSYRGFEWRFIMILSMPITV